MRKDPLTAIAEERVRQIHAEGWTLDHDDSHDGGTLAAAAGCYALYADAYPNDGQPPPEWPLDAHWWKPRDFRRDLERAGALIVAELERLDRAAVLESYFPVRPDQVPDRFPRDPDDVEPRRTPGHYCDRLGMLCPPGCRADLGGCGADDGEDDG